jgi:hypothetical protein
VNGDAGTLDRRRLAKSLKILLDVLFYLVILVGVLLLLSLPTSLSSGYRDGWDLTLPVAIGEGSLSPRLQVEITQESPPLFEYSRIADGKGLLHLFHHQRSLFLLNAAFYLLLFLVLLWGIHLLRRILATTAGGRPFDPTNPRRMSMLGWLIVAASLLATLLRYLASRWALSKVTATSIPLAPMVHFDKEWIFCGLLVLVLAGIWKQAVQIAEEQSLTV